MFIEIRIYCNNLTILEVDDNTELLTDSISSGVVCNTFIHENSCFQPIFALV